MLFNFLDKTRKTLAKFNLAATHALGAEGGLKGAFGHVPRRRTERCQAFKSNIIAFANEYVNKNAKHTLVT